MHQHRLADNFFCFLRINFTTRHLCSFSKQRTGRRQPSVISLVVKRYLMQRRKHLQTCPDFANCSIPTDSGTSNALHAKNLLQADPQDINNSRYPKVFNMGEHPFRAVFFQPFQCFIPPSLPSSPGVFLGFVTQHK